MTLSHGVSRFANLCGKHRVGDASIYKWKAKFGGMAISKASIEPKCPFSQHPSHLYLFAHSLFATQIGRYEAGYGKHVETASR